MRKFRIVAMFVIDVKTTLIVVIYRYVYDIFSYIFRPPGSNASSVIALNPKVQENFLRVRHDVILLLTKILPK